MYSLAFNTWQKDGRGIKERTSDPRIMDIGWTEVALPKFLPGGGTCHLILEESRFLGQGNSVCALYLSSSLFIHFCMSQKFLHGTTEVVQFETLCARLQHFFSLQRDGPVILLIFGRNRTYAALNKLKVDTSKWEESLKPLLAFGKGSNSSTCAFVLLKTPQ
jgi:hypothetical protein